ncbi:MAG TPA: septum site-determining protein MinC [Candidatus Eisenbergiella merdipullorum]|uniref:Probable septum site-determining protein MinC n=1 Tax=Candidatus Eisenbergiella merdipullorum TaxID=2838553 RepID=A0A9D2I7Q8_9FIRM|nr:septum site-determining protein MinC [Candidatus Eisenbergiella merdipullorum]
MVKKEAVVIKSFRNGIRLYLDETMEFDALAAEVAKKFRQAAPFFQDASVAVSFEGRRLTPAQEAGLVKVITENSGLEVTCLIGKEEEDGTLYARAVESAFQRFLERENTGRFYRGTLKRGQILEATGSVVLIGDVCPGACVISSGSVVVLGALRGTAISGGDGRAGSFIAALEMTPEKLKIGDFKYLTQEKENSGLLEPFLLRIRSWAERGGHMPSDGVRIQPQVAYVDHNRIICKTIYE